MEAQIVPLNQNEMQACATLSQLVDELVVGLLPRTAKQNSLIVNDVRQQMFINADKNILAAVLNSLLNTAITHTQNNCIRVSAKLFGNITLVHLKNNDSSHDGAIAQSLKQIQPMAEKLGGCVAITCNKIKGTTVAFTFNNSQLAVA